MGVKVAFHLEPYKDRSPESVRADLDYMEANYGTHEATYRYDGIRGKQMLV